MNNKDKKNKLDYFSRSSLGYENCEFCHGKKLSKNNLLKFKTIINFEDTSDGSHIIRQIKQCPSCEQLYFYEFFENNWPTSNLEEQYRTFIPVINQNQAAEYNKLSDIQIAAVRPAIHWNFTDIKKDPIWV